MVRTELRVIYGDTDQMGVVYYANYLRFMEAGRNEFIRAHGLRYRDFEERFGLRLPVAEAKVSYRMPARYDDVVAIETSLAELKRASVRFEYRILRVVRAQGQPEEAAPERAGGSGEREAREASRVSPRSEEVLATGETVHACVDLDGRVRRLPPELVALLSSGMPAVEGD